MQELARVLLTSLIYLANTQILLFKYFPKKCISLFDSFLGKKKKNNLRWLMAVLIQNERFDIVILLEKYI